MFYSPFTEDEIKKAQEHTLNYHLALQVCYLIAISQEGRMFMLKDFEPLNPSENNLHQKIYRLTFDGYIKRVQRGVYVRTDKKFPVSSLFGKMQ